MLRTCDDNKAFYVRELDWDVQWGLGTVGVASARSPNQLSASLHEISLSYI